MDAESTPQQLEATTIHHQQPVATPKYILRGHNSSVQALHFFGRNSRIASGDADGWIVIWDVVTKRPSVVWKAHEASVLEVKGFYYGNTGTGGVEGEAEIYTHGRDHKLRVWKMRANDEGLLDKVLPVERGKEPRAETVLQPWLIHSLSVNALNFCAFSLCFIEVGLCHDKLKIGSVEPPKKVGISGRKDNAASSDKTPQQVSMLIAAPNALNAGGVDIFHLPTERRVSTIAADSSTQTGMIMAVNIFLSSSGVLYVVSGFEGGHVMAHVRRGMLTLLDARHHDTSTWKWDKIYSARPHTQPVLSLDVSPANDYFLTSSADALLIKHPIPDILLGDEPSEMERNTPLRVLNTKHAGQQGLRIRSDGKVFATAGWDSKIRVYSCKTMKELAVLKWHKEGCCAVAFAGVSIETIPISRPVRDQNVSSEDDKRESTPEGDSAQVEKMNSLRDIQRQRSEKVQLTHWLAAGSKDGKTTLWEIY